MLGNNTSQGIHAEQRRQGQENTSITTDLMLLFTSRVQGTWLNSETVSRDGCSDTMYALLIRFVIYLVENLTKYLDYKFDKIGTYQKTIET